MLAEFRGDWKIPERVLQPHSPLRCRPAMQLLPSEENWTLSRLVWTLQSSTSAAAGRDILDNAMGSLKNPLSELSWFDARWQLKPCSMHIVNLGVLQVHNGSCLQLLIEQNFFGTLDVHAALHEASLRFRRFASAAGMQHSVGIITPGMMHDAALGAFPCLTLKAYNGRIFLSFLHVCLRTLCAGPDHSRSAACICG